MVKVIRWRITFTILHSARAYKHSDEMQQYLTRATASHFLQRATRQVSVKHECNHFTNHDGET
jgi:hypothetical protein